MVKRLMAEESTRNDDLLDLLSVYESVAFWIDKYLPRFGPGGTRHYHETRRCLFSSFA